MFDGEYKAPVISLGEWNARLMAAPKCSFNDALRRVEKRIGTLDFAPDVVREAFSFNNHVCFDASKPIELFNMVSYFTQVRGRNCACIGGLLIDELWGAPNLNPSVDREIRSTAIINAFNAMSRLNTNNGFFVDSLFVPPMEIDGRIRKRNMVDIPPEEARQAVRNVLNGRSPWR